MSNMAEYARIFETGTDDDWVSKRKQAVADVAGWFRGLSTIEAIRAAAAIAQAVAGAEELPGEIVSLIEAKIQDHAPSFTRDSTEGGLQIQVVLMVAAIDTIDNVAGGNGWTPVDALAASFWSALWFQSSLDRPKLERLRSDLLAAGRRRVLNVATAARKRRPLPAIGPVNISQDSVPGQKVNQAFAKAVEPLLTVLQENAALDREELDFAWWLLADRSDSLEKPLSAFEGAVRAVVAGIDAAARLRKLPADAHRHMAMRNVADGVPSSLIEIVAALGEDRAKLAAAIGPVIADAGAVFPLLGAIATGDSGAALANEKFASTQWGARALLEASIHHLESGTAGVL